MHAIYGLEATGVGGAYEATGEVHFYCGENHAEKHAIAEGYRSSANFSDPQPIGEVDVLPGTECEWCGAVLTVQP